MRHSLLFLLLIFAACTAKSPITPTIPADNYSFTSSINAASKAAGDCFESRDMIGVFAAYDSQFSELHSQNILYTFDGTIFTSATPIKHILGTELAFRAIYPYSEQLAETFTFDVKQDQSDYENYTLSDLMTSQTPLTSSEQPNLNFSHRLSLITINITKTNVDLTDAVSIVNAKSSVAVNLAANTFTPQGDVERILACDNGTNSFRVIVAPQSIAKGTEFIEIEADSKVYKVVLKDNLELLSGKAYTYNGEITATGNVVVSGVIDNWGDGGEINGENATQDEDTPSISYDEWLGTWTIKSTTSTEAATPIETQIVITQGDKLSGQYNIYGWDLSIHRWEYPLEAIFDANGGSWSVRSTQLLKIIDSQSGIYYRARCFVYGGYNSYHFIDQDFAAFTATSSQSGVASVECYEGVLGSGDVFSASSMVVCKVDGGDISTYQSDASLALDPLEMMVGPFTLTKVSTSQSLPQ